MPDGKIFVTGGTGSFGQLIKILNASSMWLITVYSRDEMKQ